MHDQGSEAEFSRHWECRVSLAQRAVEKDVGEGLFNGLALGDWFPTTG